MGGVISAMFTILLIIGDNILHLSIVAIPAVVSQDILHPDGSDLYDNHTLASFVPIEACQKILRSPVSLNGSDILPCSINSTDALPNLANTVDAYSVLDEGISQRTGTFAVTPSEFSTYSAGVDDGSVSEIQVVTYGDPQTNLSHALLFNMTAATIFSSFSNGTDTFVDNVRRFGTDFAASTVSMVTECIPATQACGMRSVAQDTGVDPNNFSIPFNCSPIFSGDVWTPPTDGLEQFKGLHSIFFDNSTGVAKDISASSQHNPFYFNVTAALISADFSVLRRVNDSQIASGAVVDAGHGRVALALTCKATVYNVNYSLVNDRIHYFEAVPASPQLSSIIKAPLQLGFGRHELYIQAQIGIMLNDITVADALSFAFSQIGIALASGAFVATYSYAQRLRWETVITTVPSYALWFVVVVCSLYAATGIAFGVVAFVLRRDERYAEYQAQLVPMTDYSCTDKIKDLGGGAIKKIFGLVGSLRQDNSKWMESSR